MSSADQATIERLRQRAIAKLMQRYGKSLVRYVDAPKHTTNVLIPLTVQQLTNFILDTSKDLSEMTRMAEVADLLQQFRIDPADVLKAIQPGKKPSTTRGLSTGTPPPADDNPMDKLKEKIKTLEDIIVDNQKKFNKELKDLGKKLQEEKKKKPTVPSKKTVSIATETETEEKSTSCEERINKLTEQYAMEILEAKEQFKAINVTLNECNEEKERFKKENVVQKAKIEEKDQYLERAKKTDEGQKKLLKAATATVDDFRRRLENTINLLDECKKGSKMQAEGSKMQEEDIAGRSKDSAELRSKLKEAKKEIEGCVGIITNLKLNLETNKENYNRSETVYRLFKEKQKRTIDELRKELQAAKDDCVQQIDLKSNEIADLKAKLTDVETNLANTEKMIKTAAKAKNENGTQAALKVAQKKIEEAQKKLKECNDEFSSFKKKANDATKKNQLEVDRLMKKHKEDIETLKKEKSTANPEKEQKLNKKIETLEKQVKECQEKLKNQKPTEPTDKELKRLKKKLQEQLTQFEMSRVQLTRTSRLLTKFFTLERQEIFKKTVEEWSMNERIDFGSHLKDLFGFLKEQNDPKNIRQFQELKAKILNGTASNEEISKLKEGVLEYEKELKTALEKNKTQKETIEKLLTSKFSTSAEVKELRQKTFQLDREIQNYKRLRDYQEQELQKVLTSLQLKDDQITEAEEKAKIAEENAKIAEGQSRTARQEALTAQGIQLETMKENTRLSNENVKLKAELEKALAELREKSTDQKKIKFFESQVRPDERKQTKPQTEAEMQSLLKAIREELAKVPKQEKKGTKRKKENEDREAKIAKKITASPPSQEKLQKIETRKQTQESESEESDEEESEESEESESEESDEEESEESEESDSEESQNAPPPPSQEKLQKKKEDSIKKMRSTEPRVTPLSVSEPKLRPLTQNFLNNEENHYSYIIKKDKFKYVVSKRPKNEKSWFGKRLNDDGTLAAEYEYRTRKGYSVTQEIYHAEVPSSTAANGNANKKKDAALKAKQEEAKKKEAEKKKELEARTAAALKAKQEEEKKKKAEKKKEAGTAAAQPAVKKPAAAQPAAKKPAAKKPAAAQPAVKKPAAAQPAVKKPAAAQPAVKKPAAKKPAAKAAFMDTKVFYEVIVPLLEVENTALICISTPQDSMNFYSEMFTLKTPDGKPLFNTLEVSLVCAACKASENPERCPHMSDEIPPWKSLQKLDMVKAIYGDKTELLKRESMGVITEDMMSVFREKFVNALFDRDRYKLRKTPLFVFVACDPNGGGDSEMGLVSLVVEYNSIVIVGMDTFCCKGADAIHKLLTAHIERLRAQPDLKDAWFIFIPEANLGHEADHMEYMLRNYRKIWTIRDKSRTGVVTTNTRKELYAMETQKYMTQESVHFWEHLVVANPSGTANEEKRCLEEFKKQLMGFKRVICHPQRGYSLPKIIYTGKSQGAKDDLVMTLLIGVFWLTEFTCHRVQAPYELFN